MSAAPGQPPQGGSEDASGATVGGAPRTVVHVLRHGEVDNPLGILYGRLPGFHLSAAGKQMAENAARALEGRDIMHVVASPLERAQETAAPVAAAFGLQVNADERLLEALNTFAGTKVGKGQSSFWRPAVLWRLRNPFLPSWGEPYTLLAQRMWSAVKAARDAALGHEAVCVSHQLPIWTLRRYVEQKRFWHDPRSRQCALGSLTSLTFVGEDFVSLDYSEPSGPGGVSTH